MTTARAWERSYRSDLDEELSAILEPLAIHGVRLYFPFFANTFPIARHYCDCLQRRDTDPAHFIKLVRWDAQIPLEQSAGAVWYCTVKDAPQGIRTVRIGVYQPQWIFAEFSLQAQSAWQDASTGVGDVLFETAKQALLQRFEVWEVFTEIPEQAEALMSALKIDPGRVVVVSPGSYGTWLDEQHLTKETLRLYFYGAPLATYLMRKKHRFIPFQIGRDKIVSDDSVRAFDTVMAARVSLEAESSIVESIQRYHERLFSAARQESFAGAGQFRSLQYHYNRVAHALQHRSSFVSSKEFADCLTSHHDYGADGMSLVLT